LLPSVDVVSVCAVGPVRLDGSSLEVFAHSLTALAIFNRAIAPDALARPRCPVVIGAALAANLLALLGAALLLLALGLELLERVNEDDDVLDEDLVEGAVGAVGGDGLHLGEDGV